MAESISKRAFDGWTLESRVDVSDDRVSIWDIPHGWRDRFWIVFSAQAVLAAAFESWFEFQFGNEPTVWHQTRSIISSTMPYIVLIGPASYMITEVSVVLSERYLAWRRQKSLESLAGWLTRRQKAWDKGEDFSEKFPRAVDASTIESNWKLILALPGDDLSEFRNDQPDNTDLDAREQDARDLDARERRILEAEAWYGRKRLAEDRGETFSEPYPNGNGASKS